MSPAVVAMTAADGSTFFNSSSISSCSVTPAVVDFAETIAVSEVAMMGVSIGGQSLGVPIPIELTGVFAPASTTNDVIMFIRRNGEFFGYLSNGIPHASINIPEEPRTPPAIRDSSVYLLSGGGAACFVYRVDVYRTMNDRFQVMWRQEIGCPSQIAGGVDNASSPTVPITVDANSGRIYFPSTWSDTGGVTSGVVSFDDSGASGKPAALWRCPVGGVDHLGLAGGLLWTAAGENVAVVNATTGGNGGSTKFPGEMVAAPIVVTDTTCLVVLRSGVTLRLRAVSLAVSTTGIKQRWSVVLPASVTGEVGMPVVVDNDPAAVRLIIPVGQTVYGLGRALK